MSKKEKKYGKIINLSDLNQDVAREYLNLRKEGDIKEESQENKEIDKSSKYKDELEKLYDLYDNAEKVNKEVAEEILNSENYQDFDQRSVKGDIPEEEFAEKLEDYKNKFQEILNSNNNNQMEKNPTIQNNNSKEARIGKKISQEEKSKKIMTMEEIYAEDLRDSKSKENIDYAKEEMEKVYKRKIEGRKKSSKNEAAGTTAVIVENENADPVDKSAAEASQKTAKEKIDVAGVAIEKTAAELLEGAQAMEAGEKVKPEATIEKPKEPEIKKEIVEKEITEEEKREIQDYIYGDKGRHLELYKLWAGKSDDKEFSNGYRIPQEAEKVAFDFFQRREEYAKYFKDESAALRQYKKSGGEKGSVELETAKVWKSNAEKALIMAQEELKRKLVEDAFAKKVSQYEERGVVRSDKDRKEEYAMITASMLPRIVELDGELEQMKMNATYETKERGIFGKMWDKYKGLPKGKRLLASVAISAGIGAGIAAFSPIGLLAGAGYVGYRAMRTLGGGALGAGLNAAVDKLFIQKKYGTERQEALSQQSEELRKVLLKEMESGDWKKEEKKMKLMKMLDDSALLLGGRYGDIAQREGKARMWTALGTGLVGGLTASGIDTYMMKPAGIGAGILEHKTGSAGAGGPHGAMEAMPIDGKPEGMSLGSLVGESTPEEAQKAFEAGGIKIEPIEIHKGDTVWGLIDKKLEGQYGTAYEHLGEARKTFAIDALKDKLAAMSPDDLKKIGISSGDVNKLNIGDKIDFGKLMTDENMAKAIESAKGLSQEQLMSIHENLKGGAVVGELPPQVAPETGEAGIEDLSQQAERPSFDSAEAAAKWAEQQGAIDQFLTTEVMDSTEGKIGGILSHLNRIDRDGLRVVVDRMGGWDKFVEMKSSELFLSENTAPDIYMQKLGWELQRLTGDAPALYGTATIKDILKSINPKEIFGDEYKG